jgi:hypothetical protein
LDLDGRGLNSSRSSLAGAEPLAGLGREADGADVAPVMEVLAKLSSPSVIRRKRLRAERAVNSAGLSRGGGSEGESNDDSGELHFD